ncbi:hypothetical protein VNO77_43589 [Canavalia gladiata]|uniref:Uncharacterized protein n=1 Tax=Canavalia gladiata TaxID=3824 RepID=A0AAN9JUH7_CANGL
MSNPSLVSLSLDQLASTCIMPSKLFVSKMDSLRRVHNLHNNVIVSSSLYSIGIWHNFSIHLLGFIQDAVCVFGSCLVVDCTTNYNEVDNVDFNENNPFRVHFHTSVFGVFCYGRGICFTMAVSCRSKIVYELVVALIVLCMEEDLNLDIFFVGVLCGNYPSCVRSWKPRVLSYPNPFSIVNGPE